MKKKEKTRFERMSFNGFYASYVRADYIFF